MKISIIGVGAVGGTLAAKMLSNRYYVQAVVSPHSRFLQDSSLTVKGAQDISVSFDDVTSDYKEIVGDVVFIAFKSTLNNSLFPQLSSLRDRIVVIVQNGIGQEHQLSKHLDRSNQIITGLAYFKATMINHLYIHLQSQEVNLHYANYKPAIKNYAIDALFLECFDETTHHDSYLQCRFEKLLYNVMVNGLSLVTGKSQYEMVMDDGCRNRMLEVAQEVFVIANHYGVKLSQSFLDCLLQSTRDIFDKKALPSMKVDYNLGQPIELRTIYLNLIDMAKAKNYKPVKLIELVTEIQSMKNVRCS